MILVQLPLCLSLRVITLRTQNIHEMQPLIMFPKKATTPTTTTTTTKTIENESTRERNTKANLMKIEFWFIFLEKSRQT